MRGGIVLLATVAAAVPARADRVLSRVSEWNHDHTRIWTEVTVEKDDGTVEVLNVPGGTVDGIAQVQWHSTPWSLGSLGSGTYDPAFLLGYVPSRTRGGTPLHWKSSCVFITVDEAGVTDIDGEAEFTVIEAVLDHWEDMTEACGYMSFRRAGRSGGEVGFDGINLIKFRENSWCPPQTGCDPRECYQEAAAGVTTVTFVKEGPNEGTILDADIELNAVNYAIWKDGVTLGDGPFDADLANTLTHEVGHLLGLDHTCWTGLGENPTDAEGNPVPLCEPRSALAPEIIEATMFTYQLDDDPMGLPETRKTTLEADDVAGLCARYPKADDPRTCRAAILAPSLVGGCTCNKSCSVAGDAPIGGGLLLGLAGLALLVRRRRP